MKNFFVIVAACIAIAPLTDIQGAPTIEDLRCEYRVEPLGIDTPQPRLSWKLVSSERNERQSAYQILVASSATALAQNKADLWDSGKVPSNQSIHVLYRGQRLHSGQRAFWKVRVWDGADTPSKYSNPSSWEMGIALANDWKATWITRKVSQPIPPEKMFDDHPAPLFRKEFSIEKPVARARAYVSGLGYYELRVNGQRVGDQVLDPGWTTYSKSVLYSVYDIGAQLKRGANAVGVMLGNGWFNPLPLKFWGHINIREHLTVGEPQAIVQVVIDFTDGTSQTVVTDGTWKVGEGPVMRNNVYLGEFYDARKEQPGWDKPGFNDGGWKTAILATNRLGELRAQDAPPIRSTKTLKPVKITEPKPGVYIADFGQNFAGWARLHVKGPAGTKVRMRYGELLYPDGTLNGMTSVAGQIKRGGTNYVYEGTGFPKTAFQLDEYTLKGDGNEVFTPHFTFHGFRYVELTGFPGKPTADAIEGLRLNADVTPIGSFSCSNELFNRIQEIVLWTELSNLFSVQSDCPHREKFGYGGDMVASSEMAIYNFDMSRFYAKAVNDLAEAVCPNGGFTETAPFVGIASDGLGGDAGPIGWGTGHPVLLWHLYRYYGDRRILEEQYPYAKRWIEFLNSKAQGYILDNGISDHESLVPKPRALTGTGFYYLNVKLFAQMAKVLGQTADAEAANATAEKIKAAFNNKFLQRGTGKYDIATQCCQAFPLFLDLVPDDERAAALEVLAKDISDTHKGHLSTGIFGTKYMLLALAANHRSDLAYTMINQRTFPGWGWMIENGATTLWEHWEYSDNTYSHNHPMFGSVSEWFYKVLAGINAAPDAAGFDKIIIHPQPLGDLKWVKASYNSVRGKITSEWQIKNNRFELRVTIPANTTATVRLPISPGTAVRESGKPLESATGVQLLRTEGGETVLSIGSGNYEFSGPLKN